MIDLFIKPENTIKDALKILNKTAKRCLFVVEDNKKLLGTLTDGDIRRAILSGCDILQKIENIFNKNPVTVKKKSIDCNEIKGFFLQKNLHIIPVLDDSGRIIDCFEWNDFFQAEKKVEKIEKDTSAVIISGGKGTRLKPFTNIFPKALIPYGNKPILEKIINNFSIYGINNFFITINYKGEMIESYFKGNTRNEKLFMIKEKKYLGTAGSLSLINRAELSETIIVTNCDVMVHANYKDVLDIHKKNKADMTILSVMRHFKIPYGVIEYDKTGKITDLIEKPEYTFNVNSGVYVIERKILDFIEYDQKYNMDEFIKQLLEKGKKIIIYPVNEKDYIDIGEWQEYKDASEKIKVFGI